MGMPGIQDLRPPKLGTCHWCINNSRICLNHHPPRPMSPDRFYHPPDTICTSAFDQVTTLKNGICAAPLAAASELCDKYHSMKIPDDCGTNGTLPWCVSSADATGRDNVATNCGPPPGATNSSSSNGSITASSTSTNNTDWMSC
jgi:hypothetical protein